MLQPFVEDCSFRAHRAEDHNLDGNVDDADDYTVWRDSLGQNVMPGTGADAFADGVIDQHDSQAKPVLRPSGLHGPAGPVCPASLRASCGTPHPTNEGVGKRTTRALLKPVELVRQ